MLRKIPLRIIFICVSLRLTCERSEQSTFSSLRNGFRSLQSSIPPEKSHKKDFSRGLDFLLTQYMVQCVFLHLAFQPLFFKNLTTDSNSPSSYIKVLNNVPALASERSPPFGNFLILFAEV